MEKTIKLEEQELKGLKELRENYEQNIIDLGKAKQQELDLELRMENVQERIDSLTDKYKELVHSEKLQLQSLEKRYGTGRIDLVKKIIIKD